MKKILYISFCDFNNRETDGVSKKIINQTGAFTNASYEVKVAGFREENIIVFNNNSEVVIGHNKLYMHKRLTYMRNIKNYIKNNNFNAVYIRYPLCDFLFLKLLKIIKKTDEVKIVIEIPTYPYKDEARTISGRILYILDIICRNKLKKYVDRIVTYSKDEIIYNIQTLKAMNGINFNSICRRNKMRTYSKVINIVAIACMCPWHGYDRFIEGLNDYYKSSEEYEIVLHLVGEGEEIPRYKKMVEEYFLKENVIFHGYKSGKELDALYDKCDIAVECLGAHRKNLFLSSSLKSREYGAKGVPIITACEIDAFPAEQCDFVLKVAEDESHIDIQEVINFYNNLIIKYMDNESLTEAIRKYAMGKCDISVTMQPIIEFYENGTY